MSRRAGWSCADLFDGKNTGWLTDIAPAQPACGGRNWKAAATPLRDEGWKWLEIVPDREPAGDAAARTHPSGICRSETRATDRDRHAPGRSRRDHGGSMGRRNRRNAAVHDRLQAIPGSHRRPERGRGAIWTDGQKGITGIVVSIGHDGENRHRVRRCQAGRQGCAAQADRMATAADREDGPG